MQKAVVAKWDEYKDGCAGKCRATFQGCLDTRAADYVYKSAATGKTYQLLELAPKVAAITYSGSKSLHGLIHVGCDALSDWQIVCRQLRGLFAANPDPAFRADEQAMRPRTGTRLPGVRRLNNGKPQSLLYLNQEAVSPRMENSKAPATPSAPKKTPQVRSSHGAGKEPTSADERATGEFSALPCDCAPLPPAMPPDDASLDELIAAFEVAEAWQSRFLPRPFKEQGAGRSPPIKHTLFQ